MRYSIVMPVYNVQNYLKDSVSDIKKQSFSDFELILVDDCATDLSGKLCDELAKNGSQHSDYSSCKEGGLAMQEIREWQQQTENIFCFLSR